MPWRKYDHSKRVLGILPRRRRSAALLLWGAVYAIYGVVLATRPVSDTIGPDWLPGSLFVFAAVVALIAALGDGKIEWLGYSVLYIVSGAWALQYAFLTVTGGALRPWAGMLIFLLVTGLVVLIAGWAEPMPKAMMDRVIRYLEAEEAAQRDRANNNADNEGRGE